MLKKIAYGLSVLFHPLVVPTYLFLLLAFTYPYFETKPSSEVFGIILGLVFISTFIMPIIAIFWMVKWKIISSMEIDNKDERLYPMLLIGGLYIGLNHTLYNQVPIDATFNLMLDAIGGLIIITSMITIFWKISAHAISTGGVFGFLLALNTNVLHLETLEALLATLVVSGLVMTSRLILKAHTPSQVYVGFIFGALSGFLITLTSF